MLDAGARRFHGVLLYKMEAQGEGKYSGEQSLYDPDCTDGTFAVLEPWVEDMLSHHREEEGSRRVHWFNSDARKWCHKGGHWEVMKLFCSPLGNHKANIEHKHCAGSMDSASLLSVLLLCDEFKEQCSDDKVHGARGVRNPWAHNADMTFTQTPVSYTHLTLPTKSTV